MKPVDQSTTNSAGIAGSQAAPVAVWTADFWGIAITGRAAGSRTNVASGADPSKRPERKAAMRLPSTGRQRGPIRPAMRRSRRFIAIVLVPLALLVALYVGAWFHTAGRVREALQNWAEARRVEGFTVGWDSYAISGFPFAVRVTIEKPVFGKTDAAPGYEARAPLLVGEAKPWALRHWRITAAEGARLEVEPGTARAAVTVQATKVDVTVAPREDDAASSRPASAVGIAADGLTVDGDVHVAVGHAEAQTALPSGGGASHLETWFSASLSLEKITLPAAVHPLGDTVERIAARLSVKGAIPGGPRRAALAAWRQDGGTLEIESVDLGWGKLAVAASGTLALDEALQPEGALSATISGYGEIIDALAGSGAMKAGDAALAKLALGLLAKPGPGGLSQITAPVSLQRGRLFIGPARIARLPNFTWE
jgi:hypothetical protein